MSINKLKRLLNLQLFAEGGGEGGGTEGAANGVTEGVPSLPTKTSKNPLADVQYGKQEEVSDQTSTDQKEVPPVDRNAEFKKLIEGDYKDLYDARVQEIVQKRLKNSKETIEKYNALTPTLEILAKKYGVDASDVESLNKAIEEDDSYFEEEAIEKGLSVEQLKAIKKIERENTELKEMMRQQSVQANADRIYASWLEQSESLKGIYPSFDLNTELQNPNFMRLVDNNIDIRTAYEVVHKDEIIPAAMQFTANQVRQQIANNIIANGSRPMENGINSQASTVVKSDVSQLSKADRQEIIRRVARGEKIRF